MASAPGSAASPPPLRTTRSPPLLSSATPNPSRTPTWCAKIVRAEAWASPDMDFVTGNLGWIEVICGPMFSGKSEELMRRLRRSIIARKRVQVFKPLIDDRYSSDEIVSHNDLRMKSQAVENAA